MKAPNTCCARHCYLKATEFDVPAFPMCAYHRDCLDWLLLLDDLGVTVTPRTPPLPYPLLLLDRLEELDVDASSMEDGISRDGLFVLQARESK